MKKAVSTSVSETVPSSGFQIKRIPTASERAEVSRIQKNADASRAENMVTRPSKPLNRNSHPIYMSAATDAMTGSATARHLKTSMTMP
jgi:hypothetical protein